MKATKQIKLGFSSYKKAFKIAFSRRIAWTFIFPVLFNLLLIFGGLKLINEWGDSMQIWFNGIVNFENSDFFMHEYLDGFIGGMIRILINILFFFLFVMVSGFIILILMSPVFAYVSGETGKIKKDIEYPFNFKQFAKDIFRGISIALRNSMIEFFVMILVFIIGFIPVIGLIGPVILFFVTSYFYGFSFMDYSNERRQLSLKKRILFIKQYKWLAITNGAVYSTALLFSFCGFSIAAFVGIISAVAASLAMSEINEEELSNC